mmetsp:Transcript_42812/g.128516  ORF Transcript_42812/g.128516 Transcript_42812/m.128516 type:complete len:95 (+) Transcript_42812:267-551(+)
MSALEGRQAVLRLYRDILTAARYFPSRKRDRIIDGIKQEFRDGRALTDEAKVQHALRVARRGLSDLQSYLPVNMTQKGGTDISITLKGATVEEH